MPRFVTVQGVQCHRCGKIWVPRNINNLPKHCANHKCNSPYWDRPRRSKSNESNNSDRHA
jgi:hypothetical protein